MPLQIVWDHPEHRILRQVFIGEWTIEDHKALIIRTRKLLDGLPHTVHLIIDGRRSQRTPFNILSLARFIDAHVAPNQGEVTILGADVFARSALEVGRRIAPKATARLRLVDTLEAAYDIITAADPAVKREAITPDSLP